MDLTFAAIKSAFTNQQIQEPSPERKVGLQVSTIRDRLTMSYLATLVPMKFPAKLSERIFQVVYTVPLHHPTNLVSTLAPVHHGAEGNCLRV